MSTVDLVHLVALATVALLFVGPALIRTTPSMTQALRNIAIWLGLAVVLAAAYRWLG